VGKNATQFAGSFFILFFPYAASVPMTAANDAKQRALGSGTIVALKVPAFWAVKLATEPPVMPNGGVMPVNASDIPVSGPKAAILDVKVTFGAVAFREAEFPLPEKIALVNFAVRKSPPKPPGREVNSTVPVKV
jgi:hypothetical protein